MHLNFCCTILYMTLSHLYLSVQKTSVAQTLQCKQYYSAISNTSLYSCSMEWVTSYTKTCPHLPPKVLPHILRRRMGKYGIVRYQTSMYGIGLMWKHMRTMKTHWQGPISGLLCYHRTQITENICIMADLCTTKTERVYCKRKTWVHVHANVSYCPSGDH